MPKVPDGRLTSIWTVCTIYGLSDSSHRRIGMGGLVPPPQKITKLPMNEAQIASLFECPFISTPLPVSSSYNTALLLLGLLQCCLDTRLYFSKCMNYKSHHKNIKIAYSFMTI